MKTPSISFKRSLIMTMKDTFITKKEYADKTVLDKDYNNRLKIFPVNTPKSKEEFLFRKIFEKHFPGDDCALCVPSSKSVACSTEEALKWDKSFIDMNDPSGRSVKKVHNDSY